MILQYQLVPWCSSILWAMINKQSVVGSFKFRFRMMYRLVLWHCCITSYAYDVGFQSVLRHLYALWSLIWKKKKSCLMLWLFLDFHLYLYVVGYSWCSLSQMIDMVCWFSFELWFLTWLYTLMWKLKPFCYSCMISSYCLTSMCKINDCHEILCEMFILANAVRICYLHLVISQCGVVKIVKCIIAFCQLLDGLVCFLFLILS